MPCELEHDVVLRADHPGLYAPEKVNPNFPTDTAEGDVEAALALHRFGMGPRPGSIATGAPTALCYAVNGAAHARIEPGIGEVTPTNTLTCLRVAPSRTTTYELVAYGRDGYKAKQQLVIFVR